MWKPAPQTTYENEEFGSKIKVLDVPNTCGIPTCVAENALVEVKMDGKLKMLPVIWFHKRRQNLKVVS